MVMKFVSGPIFAAPTTATTAIQRFGGLSNTDFGQAGATYELDGRTETLQLDGKIDPPILSKIQVGLASKLITDIAELAPRVEEMKKACAVAEKETEGEFQLGDDHWFITPQKDPLTSMTKCYEFRNESSVQAISLYPKAGGAVDLMVRTQSLDKSLRHGMRASVGADQSVCPSIETVTWNLVK